MTSLFVSLFSTICLDINNFITDKLDLFSLDSQKPALEDYIQTSQNLTTIFSLYNFANTFQNLKKIILTHNVNDSIN